ncbi:MAG: MAPEG family protein [Pseudomonadota bacterium]
MPPELMPGLLTVSLYIGISTLVLIWLSLGVGKLRGDLKVSVGDGGNPRLIRAMRGQANFVENVPMTLLLLLAMALLGTPIWLLHIFGLALIVARIAHGVHFLSADAPGWQRSTGAGLTILVQLVGTLGLLGHIAYRMVL